MGRPALLPMASATGTQIVFTDKNWVEFERSSYRTTFPGRLREQIQRAWQQYADEALFAEPLSAAEDKVTKVKKALATALRIVRQELMGGGDAGIFARHLIKKHLPALPAATSDADSPPQDTVDFFKSMFADDPGSLGHVSDSSICGTVQSYLRACELAEIELKEWRAQRKSEGSKASPDLMAWEKLVRRLVDLLEAAGFRASARHDAVSPFVALVLGMQACLPPRFSRTTGDDALSQQISRVLRAIRAEQRQRRSMDAPPATPTTRQRNRVDWRQPSRST